MPITFIVKIERNPNALIDVNVQLLTESGLILLTEDGFQLAAE
ncbi:hypothetical protein [Neptuniibacter sp.]|nr:hypothetical protein [Neptuniibacter sp.]